MDNNIKNRKILIVDDEVELLNLLKTTRNHGKRRI